MPLKLIIGFVYPKNDKLSINFAIELQYLQAPIFLFDPLNYFNKVSKFKINLYETIFSLTDTLDLVSDDQIYHSKRVAYLAVECGKALNWGQDRLDDLFLAALLHDCGIFETAINTKLRRFDANNVGNHCAIGSKLLQRTPLLAYLSDYVLYHHTPWKELMRFDLPYIVKIVANCIYMVDRVDVLVLNGLEDDPDILASKREIRKKSEQKQITGFSLN